ncbi:hypothetical protein D3C78_1459250 [compost metagenome]
MLTFENNGRRFNHLVFNRHCRGFHDRAAEVSAQHFCAAMTGEGFIKRGNNGFIERLTRTVAPVQFAVVEPRFHGVALQAKARHGVHVFMQQTAFQQLADQNRYAACRLEMVDVSRAVRVETCHQRNHIGKFREVIPVNQNARSTCHRHQVHGVVR